MYNSEAALKASSAHKKFRLARKKINAYSIHQPARYASICLMGPFCSIEYSHVYTFCSLINASIPGTLICVLCSKFSEFHSELLFHDAMEFYGQFLFPVQFYEFFTFIADFIWYGNWKAYCVGHFVLAFLFINVW